MKEGRESTPQLMAQLLRLLRVRVWISERLQPTEWQATLLWASLAGFLGALAALVFGGLTEGIHTLLTGSDQGVVETFKLLPWWGRLAVPAVGGLLAGAVLLYGKKLTRSESSTDYMEAIVIGTGRVPLRSSLVKSTAALFSIGSGGSIGREGPMVQLSAMMASLIGRWRKFSPPHLRLLVACGAAAGIASAYHAPLAGSFFVAEIILGSIAMESLGALVAASVTATLTITFLSDAHQLYEVPAFTLNSPWEMAPYILLGIGAGVGAPWFLHSLRATEKLFVATRLPLALRLGLGGLAVGGIAVLVPEVCGNGYSVVVLILQNDVFRWESLALLLMCKWAATASSFGSGAPGGVFTPTLFVGAAAGMLFGTAVEAIWPLGTVNPTAFALVGMGAFLSAATRAPIMAVIMLFEMTLSYDIVLPLLICSVIAYYTAKGLEVQSLYSEFLQRKAADQRVPVMPAGTVAELMKDNPPSVPLDARFAEIARIFLGVRVNNLYVVNPEGHFVGAIALHDIKPYMTDAQLAELVLARDIVHEDFPVVNPGQSLVDAFGTFVGVTAERLPVVDDSRRLVGSLSKSALLLALVEQRKKKA